MCAVESSTPHLPAEKPRYAMGLGTPPQILEMIARGIDMFDCVLPTRLARHGTAFTMDGPVHIKGKRFEFDHGPLDAECSHPLTADFSRAYIRHLFRSGEILAPSRISNPTNNFANSTEAALIGSTTSTCNHFLVDSNQEGSK